MFGLLIIMMLPMIAGGVTFYYSDKIIRSRDGKA
jgi:hypothetical protein